MLATELQYAVRSLTRGRARIRHERLRGLDNETCTNIESFLLGLEGVTGCALNPRVGSLLVTWDETKTNADALLESAAGHSGGCPQQSGGFPAAQCNQRPSIRSPFLLSQPRSLLLCWILSSPFSLLPRRHSSHIKPRRFM